MQNISDQLRLSQESGSVSEWFENLDASSILAMSISTGFIVLVCVGIVCYILKKRKSSLATLELETKVIQISNREGGFHKPRGLAA